MKAKIVIVLVCIFAVCIGAFVKDISVRNTVFGLFLFGIVICYFLFHKTKRIDQLKKIFREFSFGSKGNEYIPHKTYSHDDVVPPKIEIK